MIDALSSCIGNTCFTVLLVMAHGHAFMSKLILNELQVLFIGTLADQWVKTQLVNI